MNTTTTAALEPITATGTRTSAQTITGAVGTIPDLDALPILAMGCALACQ